MRSFGFIVLTFFGLHVAADEWSYWGENGPEQWPGICQKGKKQSPIDIVTDDVIRYDLDALEFVHYDYAFTTSVTNNGHSIQIEFKGIPIHLKGGSLPSTFILEQMHFHWSSEHTIDGDRYPLELHIVHYDKHYENVSVAANHEGGVAVLAVLFELSNTDNEYLAPIMKATEIVSRWVGRSTVQLKSKIIPSLLLPTDRTSYYRYEGSLTTPACQEAVTWFILTETLPVSEEQLEIFRNVESPNGFLKFNYRPLQPLNARKVYHHLPGYSDSSSTASKNFLYLLASVLSVRLFSNIYF